MPLLMHSNVSTEPLEYQQSRADKNADGDRYCEGDNPYRKTPGRAISPLRRHRFGRCGVSGPSA